MSTDKPAKNHVEQADRRPETRRTAYIRLATPYAQHTLNYVQKTLACGPTADSLGHKLVDATMRENGGGTERR